MKISKKELNEILNLYKEKLSIKEVSIRIQITSNSTSIYFDESKDEYCIKFNESGKIFDFFHELGHILLTKKTGCLIFSSPPTSAGINNEIIKILDYLINLFVNSNISRIEEIYPLYEAFFKDFISFRYRFKSTSEELAFNICANTEYLFNLRPSDHSIELIKYLALHKESLLQRSSIPRQQYENILPYLSQFREIKYSNDAQKIINFIQQISCKICEVSNYKDKNYINNQVRMVFSDCL